MKQNHIQSLRSIFPVPVWVKDEHVEAFTSAWVKANLKSKAEIEAYLKNVIIQRMVDATSGEGHAVKLSFLDDL